MATESISEVKVERRSLRPIIVLLLVIVALGLGFMVMGWLMKNPIVASTEEKSVLVPQVEVYTIRLEDYKIAIATQGKVEPVTQTRIVSEVSGSLVEVSDKLKTGGHFRSGEVMLKLSKVNYQARLAQVHAEVADARLRIVQEEARAEQSMRDWKKLGRGGEPGILITREPQLVSARAALAAAEAAVLTAERDLEKTVLKAPYECLVEHSHVDRGGYVAATSTVAEVYAADRVQIRLPLSLEDVSYLPVNLVGTEVDVEVTFGGRVKNWKGKVVRTEGKIDRATQTLMTVVEVVKSSTQEAYPIPPVGLFVRGSFLAEGFKNIVKLPREALRGEETVWLVDQNQKLQVRQVVVERSERDFVIITNGVNAGEQVIVSPIELPIEGMAVEPTVKKKTLE